MRIITLLLSCVFLLALVSCSYETEREETETAAAGLIPDDDMANAQKLRHVVIFKFKEDATEADIRKVEEAFAALPAKIDAIEGFEWGTNNSPEGLNKGFTHCFLLTFASEEDRAAYLPHPDHKAFGTTISPYVEDVMVVDYWAGEE